MGKNGEKSIMNGKIWKWLEKTEKSSFSKFTYRYNPGLYKLFIYKARVENYLALNHNILRFSRRSVHLKFIDRRHWTLQGDMFFGGFIRIHQIIKSWHHDLTMRTMMAIMMTWGPGRVRDITYLNSWFRSVIIVHEALGISSELLVR